MSIRALAAAASAVALSAACSFEPTYEGSKLDCTDKPCPKGWYCPVGGEKVCREGAPPSDGGVATDRGPETGDGAVGTDAGRDAGGRDAGGCENECAADKLVECTGENGYHMCGDWDGTGCLVWGPEQYCTGSCVSDSCEGCAIDCAGKECGADGCSGSCGSCTRPPEGKCKDNRTLESYAPDGTCNAVQKCSYTPTSQECTYGCFNGACVDCTPDCSGKECGDDGCGVDCGACDKPPPGACLDATRLTYHEKTGACQSFVCAYSSQVIWCQFGCQNAQCVNCTPSCAGKQCGSDGCGGDCGACGAYAVCGGPGQCACSDADHLNCNNQWNDGCETNRASDKFNCGSCGNTCTLPNATVTGCSAALCRVVTCAQDFGNCNGADSDGCEANLKTDAQNCTQCGKKCDSPPANYCLADAKTIREYNASGTCGGTNCTYAASDRACQYACANGQCTGCVPNCAGKNCGDDGCGGSCGTCNPLHVYTQQCTAGVCTYDLCETMWADADGDRANGCEAWDYFPKAYGGAGFERPYFVEETSDLGFIVAGYTDEWGAGGWDLLVMKLDENGAIAWQKAVGGISTDEGHAAALTSDDGVVVAGYTSSAGAGNTDMAVVKLSASGAVQFQKVFGGTGEDKPYSVKQTSDGGYVLAGKTATGTNGDDMVVLKLDSAGGVQWQKTCGGAGTDWAYGIQQAFDGGYIIVGRTESFGAGGSDFWVIKTDAAGEIVWQKTLGGAGDDRAYSVFQTIDDGYAVAGVTSSVGAGGRDFVLAKLDASGNVLWQKLFGGALDDYIASVLETFDDGLLLSGYTLSFGAGGADFWVLKTTATGNVVWQKTYGGAGDDMGFAAGWTSDDGFVIAGMTRSFGAGSEDAWVVRMNADGTVPGSCAAGIGAASACQTGNASLSAADTSVAAVAGSLSAQSTSFGAANAAAVVQKQCTSP